MIMTAENKEWMAHALNLGQDNMHLFGEKCWEWIAEFGTGVFYKAYMRFGGSTLGLGAYTDGDALNAAITYAEQKIEDCFAEIERRFNLEDDAQ